METALRMMRGKVLLALFVVLTAVIGGPPAQAQQKLDYKAMTEEIGQMFGEALALYQKGNIQDAKVRTQAAYLEVFENLEGPIRINVSARKNYELEQEFVAIRKMIVDKEPASAIEKRMNSFVAELRTVTAKLEGGYELVAERGDDANAPAQGHTGAAAPAADVEPAWQQSLEGIQSGLARAVAAYRGGDAKGGAELVVQTQFDHYKNSLLETAVRRQKSQKKDYQNNAGFVAIAGMMQNGSPVEEVQGRVAELVKSIESDLPGLPLVDGAGSGNPSTAAAPAEQDWSRVVSDLFARIGQAIELYEKGEKKQAGVMVQEAYFDIFEGSGMEAKIGARDPGFKGTLEGHFSRIAGHMKSGAPSAEIVATFETMKRDFQKGAQLLGKGQESPLALFFYSLMIILREGIEAILIVTAIIAYLVKTGNHDKLKTIYNGCFAAIGASLLTALLVKWVFKVSAASQEALEGWTMLLAAAVLFSVSYWLVSKAEAKKWSSYIKDKVGDSISSKSLKALWFAAFLAIFREGAETVLFYQALVADSSSASGVTAVAAGFALGCLLLVGVFLGMRRGAVKLPIRPFFLATGALLYYMAFVFAGKGVMELISGKMFEPSLVSWMPTVEFIGLYPYLQTLIPQLVIVLAALAAVTVLARRKGAPAGK